MTLLRNLLFYPVFYGVSVFFVIASGIARVLGAQPLRRTVRAWVSWHRWCVRNLLGIALRIEGERPDGPVLYAVKHESFFEAIDLPCLFDTPAIFAKEELFAIPVWGGSAVKYGCVPVARDRGAVALRRMITAARGFVTDGRPLVIFPEGTRVPHGQRRPLQSGFAGLYKLLGLPVVPVAVNSGPLYHRGLKRSGTITYRFGEAIAPGLERNEVERQVLDAMNALNPAPAGDEAAKDLPRDQ